MNLASYTKRVKQAQAKLSHLASGATLAERRVKFFKRRYADAATQGHEQTRLRAERELITWRAKLKRAENLQEDWRQIKHRRVHQKLIYLQTHPQKPKTNSVYDGIDVAPWMVGKDVGPDGSRTNWLDKIRAKGWSGQVVSGVRSVAHSIELCEAMCGASSCPGRCAGATSNHNCGDPCKSPDGAIDVTDYSTFGAIARQIGAPLQNQLGAADPVHFSYTGH